MMVTGDGRRETRTDCDLPPDVFQARDLIERFGAKTQHDELQPIGRMRYAQRSGTSQVADQCCVKRRPPLPGTNSGVVSSR